MEFMKGQPLMDIRDEYEPDRDTCSESEIAEIFPLHYQVKKKTQLSESFQDSNTCVRLVADNKEANLAAASKKGEITLVNVDTATKMATFSAHTSEVTSLKFCPVNSNLLYSSSLDNTVKVWDLRSNNSEQSYQYTEEDCNSMEFTCLDVNSSGEFLCAGTSLLNEESAYLIFWDARNNKKTLGGYSESHSDDITHLKFHPSKRHILASGAMDNLINVYDIVKPSEADAFSHCIDFGTTPDYISWDRHSSHSSKLFAVNYPQQVQYWDIDGTKPIADLSAKRLCKAMKRQRPEQCHFISLNYDSDLNPMLMVSSNLSCESQQDACIRTITYNREKNRVKPHAVFELKGNKSVQVYDSVFLPTTEVFVTLESGCLRYWGSQGQKRSQQNSLNADNANSKKLKQ
uniref:WD repeat-containing protein 89 n=1 Tax=Hirondellea gigas TaxID=1518452 RepID=A0A6A7G1F7_9CRUS